MQQRKPSCLGRLVTSMIMFVISSLFGGLVVLVVTWLYPTANPYLGAQLEYNQVPYATDVLWGFWVIVPGLVSMLFALITTLITNRILSRRSRTA